MDEEMTSHDGDVIGFIGGGMMAAAMMAGMTERWGMAPTHIHVSDHKEARCRYLRERYGVLAEVGADRFIGHADVVILAVKPSAAVEAMGEIAGRMKEGAVLVSIVAGLSLAELEAVFPARPIVRVMPNTPLAVGEGMSAYALNGWAERTDVSVVSDLLSVSGRAVEVKEEWMDAVTGLSGSGPAYGFLMIEALADGGVMMGLPRETATMLAAQTLLGAARMVLATGEAPAVLKEQVMSPAGTTIAGVRLLEAQGVRGALMDAVSAATERAKALGAKA
ncbi:MAG: pyrroline-5-carboxylate reductase [Schwartzia sp. (in: firmicutes)]